MVREGFGRAVMLIAAHYSFQPFSQPQSKPDLETDTESTPPLASMRDRLASLAKDEEQATCVMYLLLIFMLSLLCLFACCFIIYIITIAVFSFAIFILAHCSRTCIVPVFYMRIFNYIYTYIFNMYGLIFIHSYIILHSGYYV